MYTENVGRGRENYINLINNKLSGENLDADYRFLDSKYSAAKRFVDENFERVMKALESDKPSNKKLVTALYHFVHNQYACLYWLRECYFSEQAKDAFKGEKERKAEEDYLFSFVSQEELDALAEKADEVGSKLDEILEKEKVKSNR